VCDHVVMIDSGRLVVSGNTDSLLERTGIVTVDVGAASDELQVALTEIGMTATAEDGVVEVTVADDREMDALLNLIADRGFALYRLTSRLTSLDEVFLRRAGSAS